jgi:hypothetical protein
VINFNLFIGPPVSGIAAVIAMRMLLNIIYRTVYTGIDAKTIPYEEMVNL